MNNPLLGRWSSRPSKNNIVTIVHFKADNSFEGFVNKKPFVTGTYQLDGTVMSFVDNGCNGAKGIYKLNFFSNGDSLRFEAVSDTCAERRKGMSALIMGKIK